MGSKQQQVFQTTVVNMVLRILVLILAISNLATNTTLVAGQARQTDKEGFLYLRHTTAYKKVAPSLQDGFTLERPGDID